LNGARAVLALAERVGGAVDHAASAALLANAAVARASGWVTATFAEVANRADLVLIVGRDPSRNFPRFMERLVDNPAPLYRSARPTVAFLGAAPALSSSDAALRVVVPEDEVLDAVQLLAAMVQRRAPRRWNAGQALDTLQRIAARLVAARYAAIAWDVTGFAPGEAELGIELLAAMTRRLNARTRCVGLPLGGSENGIGAMHVSLWQTGWPLPLGFAAGAPHHDPWQFDGRRLIASGEADSLVWIAALAPRPPPATSVPVIAVVSDDVELPVPVAVEIRVGIPGIDHPGEVVRADTVIALPLQAARPSDRPSVADAACAILVALDPAP
jgi:formylmethanofuran dehydrogenase subunit B